MSKENTVNLDELVSKDLSVELNGKSIPVKALDGYAYQLIASMKEEDSVAAMYKVAGRSMPSLTEDEVLALTPAQVGAVVQIASGSKETSEVA